MMKPAPRIRSRRQRQQGLVTVLLLILLLLVGIFVAANNRALAMLQNELRLLQQRHALSEPVEPEEGR